MFHSRLANPALFAILMTAPGCGPAQPNVNRNDAAAPRCGDGMAQGWEECDLDDLKGASCTDLGLSGGELGCTAGCTLDASGCHGCGNGVCEAGEDRASCPEDCGAKLASASAQSSCVVLGSGAAYCWGNGVSGSLGTGSFEPQQPPSPVVGGAVYALLDRGSEHTCVIHRTREVSCFGSGWTIGDPNHEDTATPRLLPELQNIVELSAAYSGTCALDTDGRLYCWGGADVTGSEWPSGSLAPVPVTMLQSTVEQVSCGGLSHCCALLPTGDVWCWGYNESGVLGLTSPLHSLTPMLIGLDAEVTQLAAGKDHHCVLDAAGRVLCWGGNFYGQCGLPDSSDPVLTPSEVGLTEPAVKVSSGDMHTCAIGESGKAWCWGGIEYDRYYGQLGHGNASTGSYEPVEVSGLTDVVDISAGAYHTCSVTEDGRVWCWGENWWGQSDPATVGGRRYTPVEVVIP